MALCGTIKEVFSQMSENIIRPEDDFDWRPPVQSDVDELVENLTKLDSGKNKGDVVLLGIARYQNHNVYRFSDGSEIEVRMPERTKKRW